MVNVISKVLVPDLKKLLGRDFVIAGGFIRDALLEGPFKDVDVFIPVLNSSDFNETVNKIYDRSEELKFSGLSPAGDLSYDFHKTGLRQVWNLKYRETIPVQIVGMIYQEKFDFKKFSDFLFSDFDYSINQCSYDGEEVYQSELCKSDMERRVARLLTVRGNPNNLEKAISKFTKLKEKYPVLRFETDLTVIDPLYEKKQKEKGEDGRKDKRSLESTYKKAMWEKYRKSNPYNKTLWYSPVLGEFPAGGIPG